MDVKTLKLAENIKHVKTGRIYFFTSAVKAKVDGVWCDMHQYLDVEARECFCRFEHDFGGFVRVSVLS